MPLAKAGKLRTAAATIPNRISLLSLISIHTRLAAALTGEVGGHGDQVEVRARRKWMIWSPEVSTMTPAMIQ
jgi:hypothetical protein